jgi:hypothetical protein
MASGDTLCIWNALANEPPAASYATLDTRNSQPCLDFDGAADEEAVFSGVLPRHYGGGGITAKLHVRFTSATSGNAYWQAAFERKNTDADADSFASLKGAAGNPNATSGIETVVSIAFTDGAEIDSIAVGDGFRFKVHRDADGSAGTDDQTTDAELTEVELIET